MDNRRQQAEQLVGPEWAEWYFLTPQERWRESEKLWEAYLAFGGSLDPEPDSQSPFFDAEEWRVRDLLMGGQACVFYGAAEFSRVLDLVVLLDDTNLDHLRQALAELDAAPIAVPPLDHAALLRGHAVHFRCRRPDVAGLRIDVMARMRGVDSFRRLVEQSYYSTNTTSTEAIAFYLAELRTPELLLEAACRYPEAASSHPRPAVQAAANSDLATIEACLDAEQRAERDADRLSWYPLRKELEQMRDAAR